VGRIKGWESPVYLRLADALGKLDETFVRASPGGAGSYNALIFGEGESDVGHLGAAHAYFLARGEFTDISPTFQALPDQSGDDALLKQCKAQARTRQREACVFVFDRDNPKIVKAVDGPEGWRSWGNGVVSLPLSRPPWRADEDVCIELLYEDDVLEREDEAGRRLFLAREFDSRTGLHTSRRYTTPHPKAKSFVREEVYEVATSTSVGMAKLAFAEAVAAPEPQFAGVNFEGFRPTFEVMRRGIIEAWDEINEVV
jgi:hypothetical protein